MLIFIATTYLDDTDNELLEQLIKKYSNMMMSTAYKVLRDHHLSEDVIYAVFWNVSRSFENFKKIPEIKRGAYLRNSTYNEALHYAKRYRKIYEHEMYGEEYETKVDDGNSVFEAVAEKVSMEVALAVLRDMDPKDRIVLSKVIYEGLKVKEVARDMNCSEGTVKSRLSRAKSKFIAEYKRRMDIK